MLTANSDGGSGDQFGNGVTNVMNGQTSQYGLMVGGSSFSSLHEAGGDTTLTSIVSGALAGDQTTIWQLVQGGLTTMLTTNDPPAWLVETVWNRYVLNDDGTSFADGFGYFPNLVLGRALTAIAHSQMSFDTGDYPDILDQASSAWISGADQSLLFQTMAGTSATVGLDLGSTDTSFASRGSASYAWTNQFAEQAMQSDFDPKLVQLFDKQAQGRVGDLSAMSGDALSITINGVAALSTQGG